MCGIAALFGYAGKRIDASELDLMAETLAVRGPDGNGFWLSADETIGLAHRRLAIIDLSDAASQPMKNSRSDIFLIFNGEIYNHLELRKSLEQQGEVFFSHSDTEVILKLYEKKGISMLRDLRGMFAFIIWDARHKKMILARDSFGMKPLYYSIKEKVLRAASTTKALLKSRGISREVDPAGAVGFFLTGSVPEPFTFYRDIHTLPAGHYLEVGEDGPREPVPFWTVTDLVQEFSENDSNGREAYEYLKTEIKEATRLHFISDVPVGFFLSSGIDSSTLLALALEAGVKKPTALTIGFEAFKNKPHDEISAATKIAKYYKVPHLEKIYRLEDFKIFSEQFLEIMDQPSIDGMNTYLVSQFAKEAGFKVAISGLGGDEILAGYPSFNNIPLLKQFSGLFRNFPASAGLYRFLIRTFLSSNQKKQKLLALPDYSLSESRSYLLQRAIFLPEELPKVLPKDLLDEGLKKLKIEEMLNNSIPKRLKDSYSKVCFLESNFYLKNQLLKDSDWAGMAHSVEIRPPLVDTVLWKKTLPVLGLLKRKGTNLKKYFSALPDNPTPTQFLPAKKLGFSVPLEFWLKQTTSLNTWRENAYLKNEKTHWSKKWAFVVFDHFMKTR